MAHNSRSPADVQKFSFDLPAASGWATSQQVRMGLSGRLARSVFRAPASSTVTAIEIKVWHGVNDINGTVYGSATNPDTAVPDEDVVFERTGITVAGHATTADDDYNILANDSGAIYQGRRSSGQVPADRYTWVSIKSTASSAPQAGTTLVLEAIDVGD